MKKLLRPLSLTVFSCIVSVATLLLYNLPFFRYVADHTGTTPGTRVFLLLSLVVVMLSLNFLMASLVLFLLRRVGRWLLALLALINAAATYFIVTYSVMMDATTLGNVFNTRYSEASAFFSWSLWLWLLAFGLLPALWCLLQPVVMGKARQMAVNCAVSLAVVLVVALGGVSQTLWISQHDTELGGLLQPWSYLVNSIRLASSHLDQQAEEIKLPDGHIADQEKAVVVLVIGESARKANFQLYGYGRPTNPLLSQQEGLHVLQARSCATYTTAGSKAILEPQDSGDLYELLPNYALRTGVDVAWRTSNWGEPPIHTPDYLTDDELAPSYPDVDAAFDGILFAGLRQRIEQSPRHKVLIVLHTSTSHGPKYADKYPKEFEVFKPVAQNVEQGEKDQTLLVNAYDNTILYTDHLLSGLIDTLRSMAGWRSAMLFVSDHGESLGERGVFMHGLPLRLAPKEQYEIPFIVWTSDSFRTLKPTLPPVLDQHFVFHSVLNLLAIESPAYHADNDIFQQTN